MQRTGRDDEHYKCNCDREPHIWAPCRHRSVIKVYSASVQLIIAFHLVKGGSMLSGCAEGGVVRALATMVIILAITAVSAVARVTVAVSAISAPKYPASRSGSTFRDCPNCPEMVVVPAGRFLMGSSPPEMARDAASMPPSTVTANEVLEREQPQHLVVLDRSFGLGKYPVTKGEFAAFVRDTNYTPARDCVIWENDKFKFSTGSNWENPGFTQTNRDPVVCVNLQDAKAYISWLNSKLRATTADRSGVYRLPNEAEWEYAARAGSRTVRWWGDYVGHGNADCNACGSRWDLKQTAPVESFRANQFGLHEMLGNVWQLTDDCWHPNYFGAPGDGSSWSTNGECSARAIRGASWINDPSQLRSTTRNHTVNNARISVQGFRVAKTL